MLRELLLVDADDGDTFEVLDVAEGAPPSLTTRWSER